MNICSLNPELIFIYIIVQKFRLLSKAPNLFLIACNKPIWPNIWKNDSDGEVTEQFVQSLCFFKVHVKHLLLKFIQVSSFLLT